MIKMSRDDSKDLIINRVVKADIYIILHDAVLNHLKHDVPITKTITKGNNPKEWKTIEEALSTNGEIHFTLVKKADE